MTLNFFKESLAWAWKQPVSVIHWASNIQTDFPCIQSKFSDGRRS